MGTGLATNGVTSQMDLKLLLGKLNGYTENLC